MSKLKKLTNKTRPTCSCGKKMLLVEYQESVHYTFNFWECSNAYCVEGLHKYKPDKYSGK